MRFTILTALLLPILASALVVPTTTGPDNAALKVRQDGMMKINPDGTLGDESSDSSVCGPGSSGEECEEMGAGTYFQKGPDGT